MAVGQGIRLYCLLSLKFGLFVGFTFTTTQWTAPAQRELLFGFGIEV